MLESSTTTATTEQIHSYIPVPMQLTLLVLFVVNACSAFRVNKSLIRAPRCRTDLGALNELTEFNPTLEPPFNRKLVYSAMWVSLTAYAFLLCPGGTPAAAAIDNDIIQIMIATPYDGQITPIFASIFNAFPIVSILYASLLLPGAKGQKLPTPLFVASSLAIGYFGLGPYLGFRDLKTEVLDENKGKGSFLFESKITPVLMIGCTLFLTYFAGFGAYSGDRMESFIELFKAQRFIQISTIDLTMLALAVSILDLIKNVTILFNHFYPLDDSFMIRFEKT
jgi:hypothetical protein